MRTMETNKLLLLLQQTGYPEFYPKLYILKYQMELILLQLLGILNLIGKINIDSAKIYNY